MLILQKFDDCILINDTALSIDEKDLFILNNKAMALLSLNKNFDSLIILKRVIRIDR